MRKEKGFTLLEIAVVVGIMGILIVTLVPNIASSFKTNNMKAARIKAESLAKNIKVGIIAGDIKYASGVTVEYSRNEPGNVINHVMNKVYLIGGIDTLYKIDSNTGTCEELIDPTSKESDDDKKRSFHVSLYGSSTLRIRSWDTSVILHEEPI